MNEDTFDLKEFDSPGPTFETSWITRVACKKTKGSRTYSRRGSDAAGGVRRTSVSMPRRSSTGGAASFPISASPSFASPFPQTPKQEDRLEEEQEWKRMSSSSSSVTNRSPNFSNSDCSTAAPSIPGRRTFVRAHSVTGSSPDAKQPSHRLKRCHSVSSASASFSSSRSVSLGSSLPSFGSGEGGLENFSPNFSSSDFDPLDDFVSPKRGSKVLSFEAAGRGRKKSRPASHSFLNNDFAPLVEQTSRSCSEGASAISNSVSFSNLARYGEAGSTWAATSTASMGTGDDNGGSKKRTLQRGLSLPILPSSPSVFDQGEEDETATVTSPTNMSVASSTRKRASPLDDAGRHPPTVTRTKSNLFFSPESTGSNLMDVSFYSAKKKTRGMDIEYSDDDANMSDTDESDISVDNDEEDNECSTVPLSNRQPSKVNVFDSESKVLEPERATVDDVIKSMTSYADMVFLVKAINKNKRQQGGISSWMVAPPKDWKPERRTAFFTWTAHSLGFHFRTSNNLSHVQISKSKGGKLLELLKATVRTCKERGIEGASPKHGPNQDRPIEFTFASAVKNDLRTPHHGNVSVTPREFTSNSLWMPCGDSINDDDLLRGMEKMNMDDKPVIQKTDTPLITIAVDNDLDTESTTKSSRPSLEHYSSSSDFMAHLHGTTPVPRKFKGRPPRLSIQSVASAVSVSSAGMSLASPFPLNSVSKSTQINFTQSDFVSTPMTQQPNESWFSNPVDGRDWGASETCDGSVVRKFVYRLSQNHESGFNNLSELTPGSAENGSMSLGLDFEEAANCEDEVGGSPGIHSPDGIGDDVFELAQGSQRFTMFEGPLMERGTKPSIRDIRRRQTSFAKLKRVSLYASANNPTEAFRRSRKSMFPSASRFFAPSHQILLPESSPQFYSHDSLVVAEKVPEQSRCLEESPLEKDEILRMVLDFLDENELLVVASVVSTKWFEAATHSHANLMLLSVGCGQEESDDDDSSLDESPSEINGTASALMERPWNYLTSTFPWACFLSEGAYKRVYKVFNHKHRTEEAVSVMDVNQIQSTGNMNVVGAELAVSVMLSSLVRRGVCPNFVATRGVFSCPFEPPSSYWGNAENRNPSGDFYKSPAMKKKLKEPFRRGRYQYIRMELCDQGDAEEFLKRQPDETLTPWRARQILFQISFALHAAADKFSLKHYDVKLLNIFLQRVPTVKNGEVVLRYGLGEHTFSLRSSREEAIVAKLADYGTANVDSGSNDQHVTIAQFTTLENTPPDYLILGDQARQGHGHDCFGLGLCMLHLFTGHAPYEEILEDVTCPPNFKNELRKIWENEEESQYSVIRSIILADVYKDEDGHIIEGEPDEVLYDTLYKFLVLFGVPKDHQNLNTKVMCAIKSTLTLEGRQNNKGRGGKKLRSDARKFSQDRRKYSLSHGSNSYVSRARESLMSMDGGMELLMSLVDFDPQKRSSALDVLNSSFMAPLRELPGHVSQYPEEDEVLSYTSFSTQKIC